MYCSLYEYMDFGFRLVVACLLGGVIGLQRESVGRPAGLRTHILVSVSSALVMITSEYMFFGRFGSQMDPTRLGAQVVSGIGFLGAGTIIRDGVNVKGLTTAASLWAVACIGLAAGTGMYWGAFFTTLLIYIILYTFKKIEDYVEYVRRSGCVLVTTSNSNAQQIKSIEEIFAKHDVHIYRVNFNKGEDDSTLVRFQLRFKVVEVKTDVMAEIAQIEGITSVKEE